METEEEPKEDDDPMEEDTAEEDTVVREIDVFFNPTVDANTQVRHSLCVLNSNLSQFELIRFQFGLFSYTFYNIL
jgi:hypothetical protein